jgi:hypothetical protein
MLASSDPKVYKKALALAGRHKGVLKLLRHITQKSVHAAVPTILDELRRKGPAQAGPQTRSGGVPSGLARPF